MRPTLLLITASILLVVESYQPENFADIKAEIPAPPALSGHSLHYIEVKHSEKLKEEAKERLDWIIGNLKSFIHDLDFEGEEFEKKAVEIVDQILEVGIRAKQLYPSSTEIMDRLDFAAHMFTVMRDAAHYVKFYGLLGTEQYLTRRIIQLNVRLLTLFDARGHPDPSITGYSDTVSHMMLLVEDWKKTFELLSNISLSVQLMFETEFVKASRALLKLKHYELVRMR